MPLNPGTKIGPFEVLSLVGAGGMGEVYRAKDKKLNRDVALKVIAESLAQDAQRMARFQREAQVLASLNHPNIATIHGLEEFGHTHALVLELVEGATLADRIAQGPMPLEEALPIARQIAEALEYAHERGVIHRDLKPANIKLTSDGKVKILDFGLAKAMSEDLSQPDNATSPTLSMAATKAGIILGTAAYMSPEQAKGKAVDRRADIWAFGVVFCEMLTGAQLYTGETASETMAAVIFKEPPLDLLPASVPQRLRQLLQRCLTREPRQRLQAIGEARIILEEIIARPKEAFESRSAAGTAAVQIQPTWQRALPWAFSGVLAAALAFSVWYFWPQPQAPVRMSVETGADASLFLSFGASSVLSPDGRMLAFVARGANQGNQIYVRSMDQLKATPLAGTEGARDQFFSPDGQWIAFFAGGKLKKVAVSGGAVVTLCEASDDRGGSWSQDDQIVFTPNARSVLLQVSAAGGKPEALTEFDKVAGEVTHRWPQFLPGGKAVLYTSHNLGGTFDNATISVLSLETKKQKTVLRSGSYARYLPSGHLLYMHEGTLFAVPFDLSRLEVEGQPAPVVEGVITVSGNGGAQYAFSDSGSFVYVPGTGMGAGWQVQWLDSQGKLTPLRGLLGTYLNPRFSPDGTRLALEVVDGRQMDVQVYDWKRDTMSRLTFSQEYDGWPVWTPDGRRIAYNSQQDAQAPNIYWNRSDGTGQSQRLTESKNLQRPWSWHPSGKYLAFAEQTGSWDIMILPMEGDEKSGWKPGKPTVFLNSSFNELAAAFSPDGKWIAYASDENASQWEVFVRPFPTGEGKWQISNDSGGHPIWSRTGNELFFRTNDMKLMVASYKVAGTSFQADKPKPWTDVQMENLGPNRNFDVHPDGKRLAILKNPESRVGKKYDRFVLVQNFFEELRRVAPKGKK